MWGTGRRDASARLVGSRGRALHQKTLYSTGVIAFCLLTTEDLRQRPRRELITSLGSASLAPLSRGQSPCSPLPPPSVATPLPRLTQQSDIEGVEAAVERGRQVVLGDGAGPHQLVPHLRKVRGDALHG